MLDLKMPGKNGFDVVQGITKQARRPRVGVFTASNLPEDKQKAERLGADLYQAKTYEAETFERFMHWLARMVDGDRKGKEEFGKALIAGMLIEVLARCA